ncbi:DNA mismatch repair endonuclease MutL [Anaerocolumna cellulosilytica]|uniref:DNA mismatch repair protein MutL n=1 Tax=Anaerocolumna cellulosilytica TaxID=433286 RepID=A0A6S6R6Z7_9FIRM|nr:DNA mismatch repair endonuclease MutL [Anaerocolumna cellulosilytica]MBB5193738.1 DNA mismatch repair protein MutL [Anaerocolumna cellulosilytica]BCJ95045.1 DNA mismatch repair endonuclease MutL [Anaerocolumna cellulosilytica]
MSKITVLDEHTINQIAAGEVIERPAAVVKELVENSIDAGSNAITVEIKEGGMSLIRITDNGSGIDEEDMPYVFLRHSTSKIRTAEDLLKVSSLGFRGEALSSIAAVSQVELVTKTSGTFTGIRYQIAGGDEKSLEHIGCPDGTTFIVRNLFYNTPARRKFLKSPVTEAGYISDLMERLAVSHPGIAFKFINNGQIKLHTSGNNNLKDIIYNVYGRDVTSHLLEITGKSGQTEMVGYIAKPIVSRGNRNYENYFINGRYIKSPLISKAIEEAYRPYIMLHRYPFTSVHIRIDTQLIDVNVHPAKLEIRFKNGEELYQLIYHTLKNALEGRELIPAVTLTKEKEEKKEVTKVPEPFEENRRKFNNNVSNNHVKQDISNDNHVGTAQKPYVNNGKTSAIIRNPYEWQQRKDSYGGNMDDSLALLTREEKEQVKTTEIGYLNEVVQSAPFLLQEEIKNVQQKSVVLQTPDEGVEKIDHKVSEQKYTEEVIKEVVPSAVQNTNAIDTQKAEQLAFISVEAMKSHEIIGQIFNTYWIVQFGDKMFLIDQHAAHEKVLYERIMKSLRDKKYTSQLLEPPIILTLSLREEEALKKHMESLHNLGFEFEEFGGKEYAVRSVPSDLFGLVQYEILIELIDGLVDEVYNETPEMILEKIASMSCKAAVKGNHRLSHEEARALIEQLLTLENPYNCPHGRPVIISMSKYEIEKKFKRIV